MPKVHTVKKARHDYPDDGIKKGDPYFWWKFNFGPKVRSKVQPRPSQLTRSEFLSTLYDLQDDVAALEADAELINQVSDIADRLRTLGEEQVDKRDNMPESLQESETGQLLEERASACESAADELEAIELDFELEEGHDDDPITQEETHWKEKLEEIQAINLEFD